MCVFACDYSQKEVRILAHMRYAYFLMFTTMHDLIPCILTWPPATITSHSNDEALISLFRGDANTDIYKQMASLIRNKPAESITSEERAVSS